MLTPRLASPLTAPCPRRPWRLQFYDPHTSICALPPYADQQMPDGSCDGWDDSLALIPVYSYPANASVSPLAKGSQGRMECRGAGSSSSHSSLTQLQLGLRGTSQLPLG